MLSKTWLRLLALLLAFGLVAAACGDSDDDDAGTDAEATEETEAPAETTEAATEETEAPAETTEAATEDTEAPAAVGGAADGVFTVGTILPVTGDLAFLGPPEVAAAEIAAEDINAAGGVLGSEMVLEQGDSGDTTTDLANQEVDRLLAAGADVVVGAASSAVSKTVIDKITGAGVVQFSPANTSPDFTTYDDGGLYFRTAPSDLLQGRVLANVVLDDDNATAAVLFRQESYGQGLADSFLENFEGAGGTVVEFLPYAIDVESFDAEIDTIVEADPDAIIVIGFAESANILTTMHERGVGPTSDKNVYGVDGNIGNLGGVEDPSILAGLKGTEPSVDLSTITDFTDRLSETCTAGGIEDCDGTFAYGAETYDAIIITALAAEIAGTDDPTVFATEINGVTGGGEKCTSYEECVALIQGGTTDIDYDGVGGPYEFVEAGEPAAASFRIATFDGTDNNPAPDLNEYVFAS